MQSKSDSAKAKLDEQLQAKVESGSTASLPVMVATTGDVAQVTALLDGDAAARKGRKALVLGRIGTQQLQKLAGLRGVVGVTLVQFKRTASPLGDPDPLLNRRASTKQLRSAREKQRKADDVPYAKTHKFADAWKAGYEERPAFLVVDAKTAGVYDTVYDCDSR